MRIFLCFYIKKGRFVTLWALTELVPSISGFEPPTLPILKSECSEPANLYILILN